MSHVAYLAGLLIAIGGLLVIDRRLALAFWYDARRTVRTLVPMLVVFGLWDAAGIAAGVFYHGAGRYNLPFVIAPEFPLEEPVFLFVLCYSALLLYRGAARRWPRT